MRVGFTPEARGDLKEIGDYLFEANPARAAPFVHGLVAACHGLGEMPLAFRLRPDIGRAVRVRFFRDYAIVYRVEVGRIFILRVAHGARNLTLLMNDDQNED